MSQSGILKKSRIFPLILFFAAGIFFPVDFSFAANTTWTGAVSSDWGTAGNWSLNAVPTSSDNVTIPDASATPNDPRISSGAACYDLVISVSGVLNGNGQNITVNNNWTNNGTFNHGNGTVTFGGSQNATFIPGSSDYYNLILNRYNYETLTVSGTANVLGALTQTHGEFLSGQINLSGNYIIGASSEGGSVYGTSTVINFNHPTNDQTIVYNAGGVGAQVQIDKAGGTFTVSDNIVVCGWNYIRGTVVGLDTHTLVFGDSYNGTFTPGALTYSSVELKKSGYDTLSVSGTGTISGNLTHTSGEFAGGQLDLAGNYIVAAGAEGGSIYGTSTVINFNHASNDQRIVYTPGGTAAQIRIDKTGGNFILDSDIVICGWTYVQGTVVGLDTYTLIFGDNYNSSFTPGNLVYGNVEINKSYYDNVAINGTVMVAGNLTHTNGQFGGGQINLAGDYIIGAGADGGADSSWSTVINLNGTGDQDLIYSAGGTGATIRVDKTSGTLTVPSSLGVDGWNYVQGTVVGMDSCSLRLGGVFHNTFSPGGLTYDNVEIRETGGYDSFTISATVNMTGDFSLTGGNLRLDINNPNINLGGDLYIASGPTFTRGTGTITFNGTDPSTFTDASATSQNVGKIALDKTNADESRNTLTLLSNMTCNTLTINGTEGQSDTLNLGNGGYTLTLANSGSTANVFVVNGDVTVGNSIVKYSATNSGGNINIAPTTYNNLQLSGAETYSLSGTSSVSGNLLIGASSVLSGGSGTLDLGGDFLNSGSFLPGTSTVNLIGTDQSVSGSNSFYNLSKDTDVLDTLTFTAGTTTTILAGGSLTLSGEDRSNRLIIQSSVTDTSWNLDVKSGASSCLDYLDVSDSNLTGESLTVLNSISSGGGNTGWTIINNTATTITVPSVTQSAGLVTLTLTASDVDADSVYLRLEYSLDGGSSWHDPYLFRTTAANGLPILDNAPAYQISGVSTTSSNEISIEWDSRDARNGLGSVLYEGDIRFRVTPYDGTDIGTSRESAAFLVNNRAAVFLGTQKPDLVGLDIKVSGSNLIVRNLPAAVTQVAIFPSSDFAGASFQDIDSPIDFSLYEGSTLYLKFRTQSGSVSDIITYHPSATITLLEGDIVKTINDPDVYIIKYKGGKAYKRLILSPSVFNSYQHLKWDNIKIVTQSQLDSYATSNLVQVKGDTNIYLLTPQGDTGRREVLDVNKPYDPDSVYEINRVDRESYGE